MAGEGQHKAQVVVEGKTSGASSEVLKLSKKVAKLEEALSKVTAKGKAHAKALGDSATKAKTAAQADAVLAKKKAEVGRAFDQASRQARAYAKATEMGTKATRRLAQVVRVDAVGALRLFGSAAATAWQTTADLADESLHAQAVFDNLPFSIDKAARATSGLADNMSLAISAAKASRFEVIDNAKDFATLADAAVKLGTSVGQGAARSIDDLTVALGRNSPKILDNLGVFLSLDQAQTRYAASLGKVRSELTSTESAEAFRVEGLKAVFAAAEDVTLNTDGAAAAVKRFGVELKNLKTSALGGKMPITDLREALSQFDSTVGVNTKNLPYHGTELYKVRSALREMGVATEVVNDLTGKGLAKAIRSVRAEQFRYLDDLAVNNNLTEKNIVAIERQLVLLDKTTWQYRAMGRALDALRIDAAFAATDALIRVHNESFGGEGAAEFVNAQNEAAGLLDGPKKGSGEGRSDFEKFLKLSKGGEADFDDFVSRLEKGREAMEELQSSLTKVAEPDFDAELERLQAIHAADAEVRLNAALRNADMFDNEIARIIATKAALLEHHEFRVALSETDAERTVLQDEREQIIHDAAMARLAESERREDMWAKATEDAQERRIKAIENASRIGEKAANQTISGLLSVSDSRFAAEQAAIAQGATEEEAARSGDIAARRAMASQLKTIRNMALTKAVFESASAVASLAIRDFAGAGHHFVAAGIFGSVAATAGVASRNITRGISANERSSRRGSQGGGSSSSGSDGDSQDSHSARQERRLPSSPQSSAPPPSDFRSGVTINIQGDVIGVPRRKFVQVLDRELRDLGHAKRRAS